MHNTNSFNSFTTNILKLKNYVNKNYQGDNKNEILLVIFNAVTSYYPDRNWLLILDNFFQNIFISCSLINELTFSTISSSLISSILSKIKLSNIIL